MNPEQKQRVRHAISFFYDMQKLRIQAGNRSSGQSEGSEIELNELDIEFFSAQSGGLNGLEKQALGYVERQLKGLPIYEQWLKKQAGVGPTMSGFLISETIIERAETVSQLWSYYGLGVGDDGKAQRRVKGEKSGFDPWRKSKVVSVLADCLIKAVGARTKKLRTAAIEKTLGKEFLVSSVYDKLIEDKFPELRPSERQTKGVTKVSNEFLEVVLDEYGITAESAGGWPRYYDHYKNRKSNQIVATCLNCMGSGKYTMRAKGEKTGKKGTEGKEPGPTTTCANCNGSGGPAPWGKGAAHRHAAAKRYMVKMFLAEFWGVWRDLEGLPRTPYYAEQYLGLQHGNHGVPVRTWNPPPDVVAAWEERKRKRQEFKNERLLKAKSVMDENAYGEN